MALAAEQDGICGHGEQLRLTPFGKSICDCRDGHVRWTEDEVCMLNMLIYGFDSGLKGIIIMSCMKNYHCE